MIKQNRKIHKGISFLLGLVLLTGCASSQPKTTVTTIGILQTASHPALDRAREGFMEELSEKAKGQVQFIVQNAEGSIAQARSIAQSFHADPRISGIFAIATPAAQAAASVEKDKPIFFAAVTDPVKAGLTRANLCGTSDMIDVKGAVEMLIAFVPNVKRVAILFNPGEVNAVAVKEQMKLELLSRQLEVIEIGVAQESEMALAAVSAIQKSDAILTPTDNTVALAFPVLARLTREHHKPLIVSDNLLVGEGALAARGVDYFQSGKKAAQLANEVLFNHQRPQDLPLAKADHSVVFVNHNVLKQLELEIPKEWLKEMSLIADRPRGSKP